MRVGRRGKDGQADAPADDRGALGCLRVGQVGEFPIGEAGDERAQVGILVHVGVGVAGVERAQLGGWRIDRRDIDRVGSEPLLELAYAPGGLAGCDTPVVKCLEDWVGAAQELVDREPDRLDLAHIALDRHPPSTSRAATGVTAAKPPVKGGCTITHRWFQPDPADPTKRFELVTGVGHIKFGMAPDDFTNGSLNTVTNIQDISLSTSPKPESRDLVFCSKL